MEARFSGGRERRVAGLSIADDLLLYGESEEDPSDDRTQ